MTTNMRNMWLENNLSVIEDIIKRYCERHTEFTYDEMLSDVIVWLICKLDNDEEDTFLDISYSTLNQMVLNYAHHFTRIVPPKEDPVDPGSFELIYTPDFYEKIVPWECEKYVTFTSQMEKDIFFSYTFNSDVTLDNLSKKYNLTAERIRQIHKKACNKVLYQMILKHHSLTLYMKYEGKVIVRENDKFIDLFVTSIVNLGTYTSFQRISHGKFLTRYRIAEMLNVCEEDVYVDYLNFKKAFTSDNKNLESINITRRLKSNEN